MLPHSPKIIYLENKLGLKACLTNYGARLLNLYVPDSNGIPLDIIIGSDNLEEIQADPNSYGGATIGRFANRIENGKFKIGNTHYQLPKTHANQTLHSGPYGFQNRIWKIYERKKDKVGFQLLTNHLTDGFPGNLRVRVLYQLKENELRISYEAHSDQVTVINLTNHSYFNLNGNGKGGIEDHRMKIASNFILETNSSLIPSGQLLPVENTPFDFRVKKRVGEHIVADHEQLKSGNGYDHTFVIQPIGLQFPILELQGEQTGLKLELFTSEPGLHLYSANHFTGKKKWKGIMQETHRLGLALETQHFPDSPNQPHFPSTLLIPGRTFHSMTRFKFFNSSH